MFKIIKSSTYINNIQQDWAGRKFIINAVGAGAAIILNPLLSLANNEDDPGIAKIIAKTIVISAAILK